MFLYTLSIHFQCLGKYLFDKKLMICSVDSIGGVVLLEMSLPPRPLSPPPRLTSIVEDSMLMPYLENPEEFEWFMAMTQSIIDECKEKNIRPGSFKSFRWESTWVPPKEPKSHRERVAWWIDMYRIYNPSLMSRIRREQREAEAKERAFDKKVSMGIYEFWEGLRIYNPSLHRQFRNQYDTHPNIQEEADKWERDFVYHYVYENKNLFVSGENSVGCMR